jgi:integrase
VQIPNAIPSLQRTAHAVVDLPIEGRLGAALPLLILDNGEISLFATSYLRNLMFAGADPGGLFKVAKAIGRFYDYYTLEKKSPTLDQQGMALLVKQFYEARRHGLTSLGWAPVKLATALSDLRHITHFSTFCATNFGHVEANPSEVLLLERLSGPEFHLWMARAEKRKKWDLLFHAFSATEEGQGSITRPTFRPEQGKRRQARTVEHFPAEHVLNFIAAGGSVRDRLCWLLLFFGGLRISELMHIYIRDITLNPSDGTARVVIAHPQEGTIDWVGPNSVKRRGPRAAFLKERYNSIPRNLLPSRHPTRAGWKGMMLDEPKRHESIVFWTDPSMGRLFWKLHLEYMRSVRLHVADDHPYYLVAQRGEDFGVPLKLSGLTNQFYRCAERIGLPLPGEGVHPHGARHFYGYYSASWLKLPKERVQKMMHHAQMSSTEVYYAIDSSVMRAELAQAHERMAKTMPSFLQNRQLLALAPGGDSDD